MSVFLGTDLHTQLGNKKEIGHYLFELVLNCVPCIIQYVLR